MAKADDDPMKMTVESFLREFVAILSLNLQGLPCSWWEDDSHA